MIESRASRSVSGALLLTSLCGILAVSPARAQEDGARATPPPGKALVFVFRTDREPLDAQVPVVVNTESAGALANGTFVSMTVDPGMAFLRIGDRVLSTLRFAVRANQSYFVRVEAVYGQAALVRTEVRLVNEAEGRRSLAQSRFVGVAPAVAAKPPAEAPGAAAAPPPQKPDAAPEPAASAQRPAAPETPAPDASGRDREVVLIAKAGSFKLENGDQVVGGIPSTFDTTSKSVVGVEVEWRGREGLALGGEIFSYKNDVSSTGSVPNARQEVMAYLVNAKYYFRAASWLYPFLGAGVGMADARYSGAFTGNATGFAYQGFAGMEFRFRPVGLYLQYKSLASKTGDDNREVKVGGSGVLAGVSITF